VPTDKNSPTFGSNLHSSSVSLRSRTTLKM